jgi:hypothetical protein
MAALRVPPGDAVVAILRRRENPAVGLNRDAGVELRGVPEDRLPDASVLVDHVTVGQMDDEVVLVEDADLDELGGLGLEGGPTEQDEQEDVKQARDPVGGSLWSGGVCGLASRDARQMTSRTRAAHSASFISRAHGTAPRGETGQGILSVSSGIGCALSHRRRGWGDQDEAGPVTVGPEALPVERKRQCFRPQHLTFPGPLEPALPVAADVGLVKHPARLTGLRRAR